MSWPANVFDGGSPVVGYYIQIDSGYDTQFNAAVQTSDLEYTFANLIAGVAYKFRIAAFNRLEAENKQDDDLLNYSEPATYTIATAPGPITQFKQTSEYQTGQIALEWQEPQRNGSPVLEYALSRDVGSGVFFEIYSGSSLNFIDSDLEHGHAYFYKVKARNVIGWS